MAAAEALTRAKREGALVLSGVVFAELLAFPGATELRLEAFMVETGIESDFGFGEAVWREAGRRFSKYAERRRRADGGEPKRMLADFLVGAHAFVRAERLITLDKRRYVRDFPELTLLEITAG